MNGNSTATDEVVRSVLAKVGILGAKELAAWKRPQDDIRKLSNRDYAASLRRHLNSVEIDELVCRATDVWPEFNQTVLGPPSQKVYLRAADALQLHLKAARYTGMALYGFYVDRSKELTKPLIFVNSAHHALAIGSAFCHEVGHHFAKEISKSRQEQGIRFYFDAAYHKHLNDKGELFADVMVALAGYPKLAAERIFTKRTRRSSARTAPDPAVIQCIRTHLEKSYGFNFSANLSPQQNLQYLAGMLHYAKLRAALLDQFDI